MNNMSARDLAAQLGVISPSIERRLELVKTFDSLTAALLANRAQQSRIVHKLLELKKLHGPVLGATTSSAASDGATDKDGADRPIAKPASLPQSGLLGRLEDAVRYDQEDARTMIVDVAPASASDATSLTGPPCKLTLPVLPDLLREEPWHSENAARLRLRALFTSAGLGQAFSASPHPSTSQHTAPGTQQWTDVSQLCAAVRDACRRYIAVRTAKEESAHWYVELLRMHSTFPPLPGAAATVASGPEGIFAPLIAQLLALPETKASDPETLVKLLLASTVSERAITLVALPLPRTSPIASEGIEKEKRDEEQRRREQAQQQYGAAAQRKRYGEGLGSSERGDAEDIDDARSPQLGASAQESAADDEDEIDLLDWRQVARELHTVFTSETCRTRWLSSERPALPLPPAIAQASAAIPVDYWRTWPRHLRWHLTGPNGADFTDAESERLLGIIQDMSAEEGAFAGRWEEAARRLCTSRSGAQVMMQYQRLTTAAKARTGPAAAPSSGKSNVKDSEEAGGRAWTRAQEVQLQKLVQTYGPRWALFSELLDMPLRNGALIRDYYLNNLDPGNAANRGTDDEARADASSEEDAEHAPKRRKVAGQDSEGSKGRRGGTGKGKAKKSGGAASNGSTWIACEDATLRELMLEHDEVVPWLVLRKRLPGRTAAQCKDRWTRSGKKAWALAQKGDDKAPAHRQASMDG